MNDLKLLDDTDEEWNVIDFTNDYVSLVKESHYSKAQKEKEEKGKEEVEIQVEISCSVCSKNSKEAVSLNCGHGICFDCASKKIESCFSEKSWETIKCPVEGCAVSEFPDYVLKKFMGDHFEVFLDWRVNTFLKNGSLDLITCPNSKCKLVVERAPFDPQKGN